MIIKKKERRHRTQKKRKLALSNGFANETRGQKVVPLDSSSSIIGRGRFERGPAMIKKIHAYLAEELNPAENAEEKSAEFVNK